jgi:hypothetical protein
MPSPPPDMRPTLEPAPAASPLPLPTVTIRKRTAAPQFFARLLVLGTLVLAAWNGVDLLLHGWVLYQDRLVESLQNAGLRVEHRLPPLNALGDPDAPLQIVVACDAAQAPCRQLLGRTLAARDQAGMPTRLVWLQRPEDTETSAQVAAVLQAAQTQQVLWPVLRRLATVGGTPSQHELEAAVEAVHGFARRLQRDLDDPENLLHIATDRTMAEALEIPDDVSVLVSGRPLQPRDVRDPASLEAALQREAAALQQAMDAADGHVEAAWLRLVADRPARVRDRYVAWILRGERARALPEARPHGRSRHGPQ